MRELHGTIDTGTDRGTSGFMHLAAGLSVGLTGLAAGYAIGIVGDVVSAHCRLWTSAELIKYSGCSIVHATVKDIRRYGFDIDLWGSVRALRVYWSFEMVDWPR